MGGNSSHLKRQYGEKVLEFTIHFFLLCLASFTLILTFLFYQNMEEFLLTRESLDIVRIFTALFVRVKILHESDSDQILAIRSGLDSDSI